MDKNKCLQIVDEIGKTDEDELFGQIVNCFGNDLMQFARFRCSNEADAEEVVQDSLVAAYRYLDGFRGDSTLKTWLFKLAASACTKKRRGLKNDPKLHVEFNPDIADKDLDMSEQAEWELLIKEKYEKLINALDSLPEEDREMLMLHQAEGVRIEELSEQFDLSKSAIKSRLFRSRQKVRDELIRSGMTI